MGESINSSTSPAKAECGVSRVFVLAKNGRPLMPCHPVRARKFLKQGRARIDRLVPFVIRLIDRDEGEVQPIRLKFDPGSKVTGIALVREAEKIQQVVLYLAELSHRGAAIRKHLTQRSMFRRRRRSANLRYRAPRFNNRTKSKGWLPPSLQSRVDNVLSWISRFRRWCPVSAISVERVRFDLQALQNPEISGVEYQQGELFGYEVREYLLEKWGRRCVYCGVEGVPLQVEHILARARGGSDRVSNLTISCQPCNKKKGAYPLDVFLVGDQKRLALILAKAKTSLRDAAAVNATRNALFFSLKGTGLSVEASSGGRTKYNRLRLGIPKAHALDAACVGEVKVVLGWHQKVIAIKATGRGRYQRTHSNRYGFPRGYLTRRKAVHGFQTGDLVKAVVKSGKKAGTYLGRVAVRTNGSFNVGIDGRLIQGIGWKNCRLIQRVDGYGYL
jgi:5-methylcytosine-specific restriction endonuclease McrA